MQAVKAPHDRKVGSRHRARQVIDATPANVQRPRLPGDRQIWARLLKADRNGMVQAGSLTGSRTGVFSGADAGAGAGGAGV